LRFIVDAQLPPALAGWLRDKGHDAVALRDIGLRDADDRTVWARAADEGAVIVIKDEDFALLAAADAVGQKVLWVRCGNLVNRLLLARFERAWPDVEGHLSTSAMVVELR